MAFRVLVTWVSRYGSTEEVAHAVATDLMKCRFAVDAEPMPNVTTLDPYQAVVLGAPLYIGRIPRAARHFLSRHRQQLTRLPVALFVLGPVHADPKEFATAEGQLNRQLAQFPWFSPVVRQVVGGRFDPRKMGLMRFLPGVRKQPGNDARDWDAIHAWAGTLPATFRPATPR